MDVSSAIKERALQVLAQQLLEEVKGTASCVDWMFLAALRCSKEDMLNEIAQVLDQQPQGEALEAWDCKLEEVLTELCHNSEEALAGIAHMRDQQSLWEVLEAQVHMLQEEPHSGDSEAEADNVNGDNVAPNPHAWPILKQKVKHEQHLGPWSIAAGNPAVTEFTTYTPYTPTELQELGRRCQQCPGHPVSAWLLRLWDEGADSILCSPGKMKKACLRDGTSVPATKVTESP
ncbi:hypothetical protein mRhiFer1_007853 [Rhinolophus ferrumequinum]|uniref:Uncharacterized protein n=1 Tax=Rhinolophus ferrumequinum TaxID=59479 RepID=A0A7J8AV27_RHIFE|nr:hypothetical protein mRhiFer1_007853 [Rhinolophus ferrumequinum]